MTRKRKVSYADLLRAQQESAPDPATAATPASPPEAPAPAVPEPARGDASAPTVAPAARVAPDDPAPVKARRRAADRATSPVVLASALNERAEYERKLRGETPPSVEAIGSAPAAEEHPEAAAESTRPPEAGTRPRAESASSPDASPLIPFRDRARARTGRAELLLFRVGHELFATALSAVEEAVELAGIRPIPEMSHAMLGVFDLRGRMIPIYSPAAALGVPLADAPLAALVVRSGDRRMALAVDDVEDVLDADLAEVRPAPGIEDADGVLLGVVRQGRALVALLDGEALVNACLSERVPETA
jgi:purine-binding chemotaxis protein CheW